MTLTGTHLVVNGETVEDGGRCEIGEAEALALIDRGLAEPDDGGGVIASGRRTTVFTDACLAKMPRGLCL